MAFQSEKGYAFKVRLSRPGRKAVTLGMGTSDEATVRRMSAFLKLMKARHRWGLIDLLMDDKGISLPKAYDAYESGTLDALIKEHSSPDLDPLVTEWSKTANAKYVKQVRAFIKAGERFPGSGFTRGAIAAFLGGLDVSGSTKVRYRAALSVFAGWLVEREVLSYNPVRQVRAAKSNPAREISLEREEAQKLVKQLPAPYNAVEAIMANGVERQVVERLNRKDIDLKALTIHARGSKTPHRNRVIRITEAWTVPIIKAHLATLLPNARVFTVRMDTALDIHKRVSEKLGIQVTTLHDWRHTYAVNSLRDGMKPTTVARQLGHRDASLVHKVYGRFIVDERDYVTDSATSTRKRMK